jgi:hypothetical protein
LPTAYVLVLCGYSSPAYKIVSQLSKLPCVTEVDRVDGPYDIIVKLSNDNTDMIKESIGKHMTRIGIHRFFAVIAKKTIMSFLSITIAALITKENY